MNYNWFNLGTGSITGRQGARIAYYPEAGNTVLFGGYDGSNTLSETWTWDGATWTQLAPATDPDDRMFHEYGYDSDRNVVVMHGGFEISGNHDSTFVWDGTDWDQIAPPGAEPSPFRTVGAFAHDPGDGVGVMFGGDRGGGVLDSQTWLWDGADWTHVVPAASPSARSTMHMAYDETNDNIILFGGNLTGPDSNETWMWNGTTWTNMAPATTPAAGFDRTIVWHAGMGLLVMYDPVLTLTWTWDGSDWTQLDTDDAPSARTGQTMTYDPGRNEIVLFGGVTGGSQLGDTWVLRAVGAPSINHTFGLGD